MDIGRPQAYLVRLAEAGEIAGSVLDVGCGTGENALYLATRGHHVLGVDAAPLAIERATAKARDRGIEAEFIVWYALRVGELGRTPLLHALLERAQRVGLRTAPGDAARDPRDVRRGLDRGIDRGRLLRDEHGRLVDPRLAGPH